MKTIGIIFIICFVVFESSSTSTTTPDPNQGIISKLIEGTVNVLKKPFQLAYDEFQKVVKSTFEKLDNIAETSLKTLLTLSSGVRSTMEQLKKDDNEKSKICAAKLEPTYMKIKCESEFGILECKKRFYEEIIDLKQKFTKDYNSLYGNYEKLRLVTINCIHLNPSSTTKCFLSNTFDYVTTTTALYSSFIKTVSDVTTGVTPAPKKFGKCVIDIETRYREKMSALGDEITKCLS